MFTAETHVYVSYQSPVINFLSHLAMPLDRPGQFTGIQERGDHRSVCDYCQPN